MIVLFKRSPSLYYQKGLQHPMSQKIKKDAPSKNLVVTQNLKISGLEHQSPLHHLWSLKHLNLTGPTVPLWTWDDSLCSLPNANSPFLYSLRKAL